MGQFVCKRAGYPIPHYLLIFIFIYIRRLFCYWFRFFFSLTWTVCSLQFLVARVNQFLNCRILNSSLSWIASLFLRLCEDSYPFMTLIENKLYIFLFILSDTLLDHRINSFDSGSSRFRFIVEFVSIKAFLKFVLDIQLDVTLYPSSVSFAVSLQIGHCRFVVKRVVLVSAQRKFLMTQLRKRENTVVLLF